MKKKPTSRPRRVAPGERLNIPMTPALKKRIAAFAKANRFKMAAWARATLEAAMAKKKAGEPMRTTPTTGAELRKRSVPRQQSLGLEPAEDPAHGG